MNPTDEGQNPSGDAARPPRGARTAQFSRPNLVTLGSAAVLAVYAAGYARTREAADRIAAESERRSPPHVRNSPAIPLTAPVPLVRSTSTVDAGADTAHTSSGATRPSTPAKNERPVAIDHSVTPVHVADSAEPTVAVVSKSTVPASTPTPTDTPPPVSAASTTAAVSATPPADTATTEAEHRAPTMRDGTYSGWGTSRHGDIQATVEIKGGRITAAYISQCLTRYSCDWIAALPPQVITRQSPDVDYVSGATQSATAFYYAVVDALTKAK